jgi:hypothetical protein
MYSVDLEGNVILKYTKLNKIFIAGFSGYKHLSLVLRDYHRLGTSENKVLRTISGPKRWEETGGYRKTRSFIICNYFSPNRPITMVTKFTNLGRNWRMGA